MHIEKIKLIKENKFGDRYIVETERLVYDDEEERTKATEYNRINKDTYSKNYVKRNDPTIHVRMSQVLDSIKEYFNMLNF